jgi:adenosylcobinamide-phosphate synthase
VTTAALALAAVILDWLLGEPQRFHPLVGFGRLSETVERRLYGPAEVTPPARRARGVLALSLLLVPFVGLAQTLAGLPGVGVIFSVWALYSALGHKSLHDHARPVAAALRAGDEDEARRRVSLMVSRDSASLNITNAATEAVLENGNDGVFGALFWFLVAGAPGAVLYRLANTLDAMWGYKNERYRHFGWAAARFDDVLNYLPARLTALTYAGLAWTVAPSPHEAVETPWDRGRPARPKCDQDGRAPGENGFIRSLACWRTQASCWDSPNAGPVMAAGAGALGVSLGGLACYSGEWHERPRLGVGQAPGVDDIERALKLVRNGVWLWLGIILIGGLFFA